eukprot:scaffold207_cov345-Pavlova_lutheri.AAC.36
MRIRSAIDDVSFQSQLVQLGYTVLVVQHGRSPPVSAKMDGMEVQAFDFVASMDEQLRLADLVISHAGAGSIFEALRAHKKLLVVANDTLMDDHQQELALELARRKLIVHGHPHQLLQSLNEAHGQDLLTYQAGTAENIAKEIDITMGFG